MFIYCTCIVLHGSLCCTKKIYNDRGWPFFIFTLRCCSLLFVVLKKPLLIEKKERKKARLG